MINIPTNGLLSPPKSPDRQGDDSEEAFNRAKEYAENKRINKCIRLLTVMAYIFSVSLVAILLSLYYVFLWVPTPMEAVESEEPEEPAAFRDFNPHLAYLMDNQSNITSGNDSRIEEPPYMVLPVKSEELVIESNIEENTTEAFLNFTSWNDTDQLFIQSVNKTEEHTNPSFLDNSVMLQRLSKLKPKKDEKSIDT